MKIKLLTNGDYCDLNVEGKVVEATKSRSGYYVTKDALEEVGATPIIDEYYFFRSEVELPWHTHA